MRVHARPVEVRFHANLFSCASFCTLLALVAAIVVPYFVAYALGGFWHKEAYVRERPLVRFRHEALAEARRGDDAAELARDAARRGIGLDDRGAAALVRAFRRSGDWQGALDLPVVGPLSAHAAVEACRAGADADRAVQIVEGLEALGLREVAVELRRVQAEEAE